MIVKFFTNTFPLWNSLTYLVLGWSTFPKYLITQVTALLRTAWVSAFVRLDRKKIFHQIKPKTLHCKGKRFMAVSGTTKTYRTKKSLSHPCKSEIIIHGETRSLITLVLLMR